MTDTTLASRIARWACALDGETLDAEVVAGLRLAVLDCLAAVLAGVPEEVSGLAAGHAPGPEGDGVATVIGHGKRTTMAGAAFANGTTAHACDYDDSSWVSWTHPTAAVLPAALAAAEARDLTGRCLLTALCVGLEVTKALGVGIQPEHYKLGWHPTGTLGVFGATAAVAKALGLGVERACAALGIAVSCSAGVGANVGTMTKPMHVGFAARNGVESALLAAAGMTANPRAFEGEEGFFDVYVPGHGPVDHLADSLGNPFEVVEPGLVPKIYPCCADLHASIDAMLALRAEHALLPDSVSRVRCGITPIAMSSNPYPDPRTKLEAKFSQEYVVAAALVRGRVGLAEFEADAVDDAEIRRVMKRVEVEVLPELSDEDSVSFASPAVVEVTTADGRTLRKEVRKLKGHPDNPITARDLEAKFLQCAERVLDGGAARRVMDMVADLENLPKVQGLVRELVPGARD